MHTTAGCRRAKAKAKAKARARCRATAKAGSDARPREPELLEALREVFGKRMDNQQFVANILHSHAKCVAIHVKKAGGHLFRTGGEQNAEF